MPRKRVTFEQAFGLAIKRFRLQQDLSQEAFAYRCEVHPTYISQLERGLRSPSLRTIKKLADALDKRPHQLVRAAEEY